MNERDVHAKISDDNIAVLVLCAVEDIFWSKMHQKPTPISLDQELLQITMNYVVFVEVFHTGKYRSWNQKMGESERSALQRVGEFTSQRPLRPVL